MAKSIPRRALLIGCDFYFQGNARIVDSKDVSFNHLSGCVEDVKAVQEFLETIGVPRDNIQKLTASYDADSPTKPSEDSSLWPTYENIMKALDRIMDDFRKNFDTDSSDDAEKVFGHDSGIGGLVYIHYSGHGVRRDSLPDKKNNSDGDRLSGTALAMTNVSTGGAYLTGYQLGARIQGMVLGLKKRLRVTLVLDSCFSGGGFRAPGIRTISIDDNTMLEKDKMADKDADEYLARLRGSTRAKIRESWLSNPVGCTVLTACDINQMADEKLFQERDKEVKTKRGVLTWWMLDLLSQYRQSRLPTHMAVKNHVKKQLGFNGQDPVLCGEADYEFFGDKEYVERPACRVSNVSGDTLRLHVGSSQGVATGAIYDIYPPGCDIQHGQNFGMARQARVTTAYTFFSTAQLDGLQDTAGYASWTGTEGCRGVLRAWALQEPVSVEFGPEDARLKPLLKREIDQIPNLALHERSSEEPTLMVTIDTWRNFEISEYGVRLERLPSISVDDELAIPKLAHVLRHVCRYRDIQDIWDRPRSCTVREDDFEIRPAYGPQKFENVAGLPTFTIVEREILPLRFVYTGPLSSVWVQVYELNPSWGIEKKFERLMFQNLPEPPDPIEISTEIYPKGREDDAEETTDRFMIFISDGRDKRSWDEILLPRLPVGGPPLQMDFGVEVPPNHLGDSRAKWEEKSPAPIWGLKVCEIRMLPHGSRI